MTQGNVNKCLWTASTERAESKRAPERAHQFGLTESGSRLTLKQLPPEFAERVRQAKVLATAGLDEGLEHSDKVIEDWKKSL